MGGNRQLQMFLRLSWELIEQHLYQPLSSRMGKRLPVTSGEGQDKLANQGEKFLRYNSAPALAQHPVQ
ncbi:Uncharacterised protein [Raoultella planticola]|nr:Uncharacterised protein [Raoultella planticola]